MPASPDIYEDGDFDEAQPISWPAITYPLFDRGDNKTRMCEQSMSVHAEQYKPGVSGSRYPFKSMPVANPSSLRLIYDSEWSYDGNYLKFLRTWSEIPNPRDEGEDFRYEFQIPLRYGLFNMIQSFTKTTASIVRYKYLYSETPINIPIRQAFRLSLFPETTPGVSSGSSASFYSQGLSKIKETGVNIGDLLLAEDSKVSRWRGNIWEIRERFVRQISMKEATEDDLTPNIVPGFGTIVI